MLLRRNSIKNKLIGIIMLSTSVALLLACTGFVAFEVLAYKAAATRELSTIAQFLTENAAAAVTFNDEKAAQESLAALRAEPRVVAGAIYTRVGRMLAKYSKGGQKPPMVLNTPEQARIENGYLVVSMPIRVDGEQIGTVYVRSDMSEIYVRLRQYAVIVAAVLMVSLLAAFLVSSLLQRLISRPIHHLAETASRVSSDRNYEVRAHREADDELGVLVDRFNEMLATIQARDEAINDARNDLERRVEERTFELQNEIADRMRIEQDLIQAKQTAEESNKAKSAFLANMSHELRTPLNAIIGYSEMLREEAEASGRTMDVEDLDRIRGAAKHLLALINDVLDLSKIEAGKMSVNWEKFNLSSLVRELVNTIQPLARQRGNQLDVRIPEQTIEVEADLLKFRQSMLNLLSNACKFTENGKVTLEVESKSQGEKEWLLWHVTDTGIGISAQDRGKLFAAFSQVDASTTRKYGGTGLGLAISKRFCQMMGGDIQVQSEEGKGSTFTIWLPAERDPEQTSEQPEQGAVKP